MTSSASGKLSCLLLSLCVAHQSPTIRRLSEINSRTISVSGLPSSTLPERHGNFISMGTKKLNTESRDSISWLPDEILGDILSLVPMKQAASTSVLSKKWRNLFRLVPNLDFDNSVLVQPVNGKRESGESFRNFLDRLHCDSPIMKFSLKRNIGDKSEMAYVNSWIHDVVECGVLEVDLFINMREELFLPSQLYRSNTLVKLTLGAKIGLGLLPPNVSLPALKILFIDSVFFEGDDLSGVILPGCLVLEELSIYHRDSDAQPDRILSQTIKRLSVHYDQLIIDSFSYMSFDAPSLVYFDYSDYALCKYEPVNLNSLVEARLDLHPSKNVKRPDVSGLIIGISNVETLHLSPDSVDVIYGCVKRGLVLPVFNNMVSLSFGSKNKRGWKLLPYLLQKAPKLETLIIQDLNSYTGGVVMFLNHVKVLHILSYRGTMEELNHLKSFLWKTECLEVVHVDVVDEDDNDGRILQQTKRDLKMLLGVSLPSKCNFKVT